MHQLLPEPAEVDPMTAHATADRPAGAGRPWTVLNMVSSIDGATAVAGRSGGLGGPGDKEIFRAIRAVADVIVAGAGTVRAEDYGPPRPSAEVQAQRTARGQTPRPRLAVITSSGDLDPGARLFAEAAPDDRPIVLAPEDLDRVRAAALGEVAELHAVGRGRVDLRRALELLHRLGANTVVIEGGPSLNGQLIADDLIDEVNLTISPHLVGGQSDRVALGEVERPTELALAHLWEADGACFARYVRVSAASAPSPS